MEKLTGKFSKASTVAKDDAYQLAKGTGNPPKITEIQEGDLGKHIIKGKNGRKELAPNVRYITEDGYKYTTDELGRIVDVEAGELILQKENETKECKWQQAVKIGYLMMVAT